MEEKRKPRWWLVCFTAAFMLLVVYPLSAGPFVWLHQNGIIPAAAVEYLGVVYLPLKFVCEAVPVPIGNTFEWYLVLWGW
jgi:hypothetical protein